MPISALFVKFSFNEIETSIPSSDTGWYVIVQCRSELMREPLSLQWLKNTYDELVCNAGASTGKVYAGYCGDGVGMERGWGPEQRRRL